MSRHSDALLSDLSPQSSSSVSTWLYLILGVLVLGAAERAYRQLAKAKQKRVWELEQRRRHGIPDDDKRPFKIAHRDAAVRARREAERAETEAKAQREKEKAARDAEKKRSLDEEWEQVNRETNSRSQLGMRRRAPPSANLYRSAEMSYRTAPSPQPSAASPNFPGAMPQSPQEERPTQSQYQPEMRQISNRATASRKRAAEDEDEKAGSQPGPSRETQRRKIDVPRGTKRTAESEEDEEEEDSRSVAHRAKIRAGKARQVSKESSQEQASNDDDASYEPSDKENQPVDEDMTIDSDDESASHEMDQDEPESSRTPRQPPQDKGKKRLLSEVDNESVVSGSGGRPKADRKRRKNRDDRLPEGGERFEGSSEEDEQPVTLQRRPSKRQPKTTARPARRTAPPPATGLQRRDSQIVRKPGDEWTDKAGCKWRWGEDGHKRRNVAVKEIRKRYDMPKDSKHPDANLTMQVLVDKWLTEAEYEQARQDRILSWQSDEDEEKPTAPAAVESSRGKSLYHLKGSVHPLRASTSMASLVGRVARNVTPLRRSYMTSGSLAGLADSGSSASSSPADASFGVSQSHSRARLVSTPLRGALGSSSSKKPLTEEERKRREAELVRKLTQADKPATPAASSPATLPATSTSTPSTTAAAPTFSFGASPAPASAPASATTPAAVESKTDAKPPTFSFGATPVKAETAEPATAAASAAPASFSFGAGKVEKAEESKPAASFSFGASAPSAVATPPAGGAPTFSFGSSSAKPADAGSAPAPAAAPASFSFGAPPSAPAASTPSSTAPSFSFGASSKSPAPAASTPPAAPATFSFGASTPAAPPASAPASTPSTSAPSFSFGASSSTTAAATPAMNAPPSFSFGGGGPTASAAPAPAPSFSFGASKPAAPGAPATAPSFNFGAGGAAPASGGFSFGSGGSTTGSTFSFGKK